MTPQDDAVRGYELALERAEYTRAEWLANGKPLTLDFANGSSGRHPLWVALQEAEAFLIRSRTALKAADRRGRPAGSSSAPDRVKPRLRSVG